MTTPCYIAVTGHRNLGNQVTQDFIAQAFRDILERTRSESSAPLVALTGLAEGTDTLFAEIALDLGIPLEAVIAHDQFIEDFKPGPARERYQCLLGKCQVVHQLAFHERSDEAYLVAGHKLVDYSQLLVAAWNGAAAAGKGGTGDVVAYALKAGKPVVHVHTEKLTVERLEPERIDPGSTLEEYKLLVEDTARLSERRQSVTNTYITVNGGLVGLISFLAKDSGLNDWGLVLFMLPLLALGVIICWYWQQLLGRYKKLVALRFDILRELETRMAHSVRTYHLEDKLYPRDIQGDTIATTSLNISDREINLPRLFRWVYIVLGLVMLVGTILVKAGIIGPLVN